MAGQVQLDLAARLAAIRIAERRLEIGIGQHPAPVVAQADAGIVEDSCAAYRRACRRPDRVRRVPRATAHLRVPHAVRLRLVDQAPASYAGVQRHGRMSPVAPRMTHRAGPMPCRHHVRIVSIGRGSSAGTSAAEALRAAPACRARSRSDPSTARRSCRRIRPAARRPRRMFRPTAMRNSSTLTGSTSWPSAATTVSFSPGMRTSKSVIDDAVDEAQPHLLAGREQPVQLRGRRRAIHQIRVGIAGHVGEIGRIHAHLVPHAPRRDRRLDAVVAHVAQEIAGRRLCRSCSSCSVFSASRRCARDRRRSSPTAARRVRDRPETARRRAARSRAAP